MHFKPVLTPIIYNNAVKRLGKEFVKQHFLKSTLLKDDMVHTKYIAGNLTTPSAILEYRKNRFGNYSNIIKVSIDGREIKSKVFYTKAIPSNRKCHILLSELIEEIIK